MTGWAAVWFKTLWPTVPVYHEYVFGTGLTLCGRRTYEFRDSGTAAARLIEHGTWVPRKHAEKFAHRCQRCDAAFGGDR